MLPGNTPAVANFLAANIENPSDLVRASDFYVLTKQSIAFVNQLADLSMHGGGAHSLQGAYGAGKSSLGIFAMNQLAAKTKIFKPNRKIKIAQDMHLSVRRIQKQGGMLAVPVIGSASSLAQRISVGLRNAVNNHIGRRPKALLQFTRTKPHQATNEQVQHALEEMLMDQHSSSAGVLLIIDEFGRQFEHMIATGNLDDLHLLQNLAELPGKGSVPFSIVIIQHHGLEHYTSRFMSQQHAEWEKVRGRFNEFLLNNSETDTANIISTLLKPGAKSADAKAMDKKKLNGARRPVEPLSKDFIAAAQKCAPLHPMTIYILARLSRLLGQGDRTVAGWLSSHLDTGFSANMKNSADDNLYPDALFLHFFGDIQNMPTNPAIAKRFNAVHSAYSRYGAESHDTALRLLKTIGLLYFCQGAGLKADIETIKYSMPKNVDIRQGINNLSFKSLITYRRHSNEYRVWEGSDYDIQTKLNNVIHSADFSPAALLKSVVPKRLLAHKHFIETGNHRTVALTWIDSQQPIAHPQKLHEPFVCVWLDKVPPKSKAKLCNCVWGVMDTKNLIDHLHEASALRHMLENDTELQQDVVASGEVKEQLLFMESKIENGVNSALNSKIEWYLGLDTYNSLQQAVSTMMDRIYKKSIKLHNEIINREQTSGQATLAARLLIESMVKRSTLPAFGIKKFPAEMLLYKSLFESTGIHSKSSKNGWQLALDQKSVGKEISEVVDQITYMAKASSSHAPCNVGEIVTKLGKPPFGIQQMPVLLLCCVYLFVKKDYVELYEDGSFLPVWGDQTLTRMLKSPSNFSINIPESAQLPKVSLVEYRRFLFGSAKTTGRITPLTIAKDILVRYSSFSTYAKKTASLSKDALALRHAILIAKSPADMLFVAFPKVFGLKSFPKQATKRKEFFKSLDKTFSELEQADKKLIGDFEKVILRETPGRQLPAARKDLGEKAKMVLSESYMHYANDSFLNAILDISLASQTSWFRNLLDKGLDIRTPLASWSDDEVANAEFNLRTRLIWLRQAAEALSVAGSSKGSTMERPVKQKGSRRNVSKKLSAISKQLSALPPEEVVPLLLELLSRHSRGTS